MSLSNFTFSDYRHNQAISFYTIDIRRMKWWQVLFFHLLDCSIVNAWVINRQHLLQHKKVDLHQKDFRLKLIKALSTNTYNTIQYPLLNTITGSDGGSYQHWPEKLQQRTHSRCNCGCGKRPSVRCIACDKPLDIGCWVKYHTQSL